MRHAIVALTAASLAFVACNKVENSEIDQILSGKKGNKPTTEAKGPAAGAAATTSAASSGPGLGWNDAQVKEVQQLVTYGNYDQALAKIGNSTDLYLRYFAGVSYYGKMLSAGRWSVTERNGFQSQAVSILKDVGNSSRDELLAARALLWNAMAVHLWHEDLAGNEEALKILDTVIEKYKSTEVVDDAILYAAKINQKIGRYATARTLYGRLTSESFPGNQVYDPNLGRWFTPANAGALGLERIRQLTTPGWRPPQPQAAAPATAPAESQTSAAAAQPAASSSSTSSSSTSTSTSTSSSTSAPASSSTSSSTSAPASSTTSAPASSSTSSTSSTAPASSSNSTSTTSGSTSTSSTTSSTSSTPASSTTSTGSTSGTSSNAAPANP